MILAAAGSHAKQPTPTEIAHSTTYKDESEAEFVRLQYQEAVETYRTQFTLMVQIMVALVIADVTVVGFALASQSALVIAVGAIFPLTIMYTRNFHYRLSIPLIYVAVGIEDRYGPPGVDLLASTFISSMVGKDYVKQIRDIAHVADEASRVDLRRQIPQPELSIYGSIPSSALYVAIALTQLAIPIPLHFIFCWQLL